MSEYVPMRNRMPRTPNASLPIPNGDERCHCQIGHDGPAPDGTMIVVSKIDGRDVRLLMREDCPHHSLAIAFVRHGLNGTFSVGVHFPPAMPKTSPGTPSAEAQDAGA